MSDATAAYSIGANLRWFAAVYAIVLIALALAVIFAAANGVNLPTTGLNIGSFIGVVYAAGNRFADKTSDTWTPKDRTKLAFGYFVVSLLVSCVLLGAVAAIDNATFGQMQAMLSDGALFIAIGLIIVALIFIALARFSLAMVARRRGKT